ncbi:TniQ family protein [Rhizobium tumorigenes]|uniref:TniQ family protein n=1 Tax=Rhizobium tumorigenes TaxID=2041385 RepID=UPI00241C8A24|nr:TniQ family protein [Rhizobium tumorigenes]WFS02368.1 TniQ family protein [Rhizobium tumorigenes]
MDNLNHRPRAFPSWQVKPAIGTSALGYFAQLAAEQEHSSARVYATEVEMNGRSPDMAEMLGELLRLPIAETYKESLRKWTPLYSEGLWRLAGETFSRNDISYLNRRFCRGCLAEGRYHRVWWDIVSFRVCPFHGVAIEDHDREGRPVRWWRPSFDISPSGEQLAIRKDRCEDSQSFEWYLLQRLGFVDGAPRPLLDDAPFHEVIDVCNELGRLLANPWRGRSPSILPEHTRRGFEALRGTDADLELEVRNWLVEMVPLDKRKRGISNGYGWFTREGDKAYVRSSLWPAVDMALRRAFAQEGRIGRQAAGVADLPHREITIKEAAVHFEIDVRGLRELARQLGVLPATFSYEERAFLTHDKVATLASVVNDMIPVKSAAVVLGCAQHVVREIVASGTLRGFQRTGLYGHAGHGLALLKSEVEALKAKAENVAVSGKRGLTHDLAYVVRITAETSFGIIAEVLDGRREIVSRDRRRRGFASWRFPAVIGTKTFRRQARDGQIRAAEAAVRSGLPIDAITALSKAGVIATLFANGRSLLDEKSFLDFNQRYVDARLYEDRLGCKPLDLGATLTRMGIARCFADVPFRWDSLHLVERAAIEKALDVREVSPATDPLWELFKEQVSMQCPSFVLPEQLPEKSFRSHLATRTTYVVIERVDAGFVVGKAFSEKSPREWRVFSMNSGAIVSGMGGFKWTRDAIGGREASCRVSKPEDVGIAVSGMTVLYDHFKNPRKFAKAGTGSSRDDVR